EGNICELALSGRQLIASFPCGKNPVGDRFNVVAEGDGDSLRGTRQEVDGTHTLWTATRTAPFNEPAKEAKNDPPPALPITYPAGPYGVVASTRPAQVLVRNATLWTSAAAGRIEHGDLLVKDGRIAAVGRNLAAPEGALIIDATGKDVSPGVIDAHSHTAIQGGVNESSSSITAEVRIGDIIDATDINIYRELAGGVTAANVLHGSANSIGGQNQVIKLRWGADAESLKFAGAMPGIKFALGENVKQSNWGSDNNSRYPQTRLGVEQLLRDAFQAARGYRAQQIEWREHGKALGKVEPRRDLQLDTLVEILDKKRVVHIHSYVADEILMFARLSQEFGFTVATFQHVLEGYKVADVLAAIGAGGSTFADWWGYKMEAFDAIPANGALMHRAGVVVTFNSDSDELARHLNTEAAKAIKYGGVAPVEALKFVTLNAAKQLRIDDRVGSLEVGKDADFVIWNTSPLSSNARAEQTWIEGKKYFDREADAAMRVTALKERERLVAKALAARPPRPAGPPGSEPPPGAPPTAADMAAVTHWLQYAAAVKHDYWDGEAWHECTGEQQ
ncbi:MAG: amidohydrolase, partial [Betaproteobacteria bacterium]|nr:amidohydrolase [Betaproteobacteria bacterium]